MQATMTGAIRRRFELQDTRFSHADRPRVLLVEDDASAREALHDLLSLRGFEVIDAATLVKAESVMDRLPDWIVLDLRLPDGDGVSLLRTIRENHLPIRVVVTSGFLNDTTAAEVERLRPDAILRKPVSVTTLLQAMSA